MKVMNNKLFFFIGFSLLFFELYTQIPYYEVIKQIKPNVVGIEAIDDSIYFDKTGAQRRFVMTGSGVLFSNDSINVYAITNEHVVALKV